MPERYGASYLISQCAACALLVATVPVSAHDKSDRPGATSHLISSLVGRRSQISDPPSASATTPETPSLKTTPRPSAPILLLDWIQFGG